MLPAVYRLNLQRSILASIRDQLALLHTCTTAASDGDPLKDADTFVSKTRKLPCPLPLFTGHNSPMPLSLQNGTTSCGILSPRTSPFKPYPS
jgi:hypothetical protein